MQATVELEALAIFLVGARVPPSILPWRRLREQDTRIIRAWATECFAPPRAKRTLKSLRNALKAASDSETDDEGARAPARRFYIRTTASPGQPASARDIGLLFQACESDHSAAGRRDAAVIALMALAGLRPAQIAGLRRGDFDDTDSLLRVRTQDGLRVLALEEPCGTFLPEWLACRIAGSDALFQAVDAFGRALDRPLGRTGVHSLLARRSTEAGIARVRPGELRAWFLSELRRRTRHGEESGHYYRTEDGEAGWLIRTLALQTFFLKPFSPNAPSRPAPSARQ
jgi:integrase